MGAAQRGAPIEASSRLHWVSRAGQGLLEGSDSAVECYLWGPFCFSCRKSPRAWITWPWNLNASLPLAWVLPDDINRANVCQSLSLDCVLILPRAVWCRGSPQCTRDSLVHSELPLPLGAHSAAWAQAVMPAFKRLRQDYELHLKGLDREHGRPQITRDFQLKGRQTD